MRSATDILEDEDMPESPALDTGSVDLSTWLRLELARRVSIVLVAPPGHPDDAFLALSARLAEHPDVLTIVVAPASTKSEEAERAMVEGARLDPDAVLVGLAAGSPSEQLSDSAAVPAIKWPRDLLKVADRMGLRDRAVFALVGDRMTRETARRMGYEDGFSVYTSAHDLVAALACEAIARERARRRGSSPPCYF
jgi:hypothetical protein